MIKKLKKLVFGINVFVFAAIASILFGMNILDAIHLTKANFMSAAYRTRRINEIGFVLLGNLIFQRERTAFMKWKTFIVIIVFPFATFSQTGTVGSPFTELGMARNVTSAGVYYFNLTGTTFSTYVDANGWVQVAIDFGGNIGGIPASTALSTGTRGILNSTALAKLGSANETRIYSSNGQLDVSTSNATVVARITSNTSISVGSNDNTFNNSWTGTNTQSASFLGSGCNSSTNNTLGERVFHACGNFEGFHWVSYSDMRKVKANQSEISSGQYFQLYVRAALVVVVNGPTINTQPSSGAQNLCLNSTPTNLSVSATANSGTLTYQWYSNATSSTSGGTLISGATSQGYTPITSASGVKYYYVICTDSQGSTTSTVTGAITVSASSVAGTVSSDQTICAGSSPANLTLSGNTGSIQWQSSTDNITFANVASATSSTLTGATIGNLSANKYFRVQVTSGTCNSVNSSVISITVNQLPTVASITPSSNCGTGTVTLTASASSGSIGWYSASSGGSALATGNSYTTPSISATTTYYAGATNGSCSSASRTAVVATINPLPTTAVSGPSSVSIDILVVGGGGGAGYFRGGGGGGGGYIYTPGYTYNSGTSTTITVGVGGNGGTDNSGTGVHATSGTNSSFGSTYIAVGGGGGGSYGGLAQNGYAGGSGGGGGNQSSSANTGYGGSGTSGQGYGGGNSRCGGGGEVSGGGGGGAGGTGSTGSSSGCGSCSYRPYNPGSGGNGLQNSISGTATYYCGGGGGGGLAGNCTSGTNSMGSNGLGGGQSSYGGGGQCKVNSNVFTAENGGSGIVIIRYLGTPVATGGTITQVGGYTIHTFTTSGTFALTNSATTQIDDASRCGPGTITFTGTATSGYTMDWFDASTGGNTLATNTLTYTTPALNQTTVYYIAAKNSSTGCVSATRTAVTGTLNSISSVSADQSLCSGNTPGNVVLSGYTGTVQWQYSTDNSTFNNVSGQTSATLSGATIGSLTATKYYRAAVTNSSCTANSSVITLVVGGPTFSSAVQSGDLIWKGTTTDWTSTGNWYQYNGTAYVAASSIPSSTTNIVIPVNQTCVLNQPSVSANTGNVKNISIETGANLVMSTGTLNVSGNWTNNGTFTPGTGTVNFSGSTAQSIGGSGTNTFYNLGTNNSSTGITLLSPVSVQGNLNMTAGNVFTTSSNLLTIGQSSAPGLINWTGGTIIGPVKRWFAASTNSTQASGIFPIGNSLRNRYAQINFTQASGSVGYIIAEYVSGSPMVGGSALYNGLPAVINGQIIQNYENEGYYEITPYNASDVAYGALNDVNYNLILRGNNLSTVTDLTKLRIIKSSNHTAWNDNPSGDGTHVNPVGSTSDFTIGSNDMQGFSWFDFGSSSENVLPVELINFQANCFDEASVEVKWTTASEHNSSNYILEMSRDGISWNIIDNQIAAGNSNHIINYSYLDNSGIDGLRYYKLTQFDLDGVSEVFDPISVDCASANNDQVELNVYPNPSNEKCYVEFENEFGATQADIIILDSRGVIVSIENVVLVNGNNIIHLNGDLFNPGIYFIQMKTDMVSSKSVKHVFD